MTSQDEDALEAAAVAREKIEKIKADPQRALFSEFTGASSSGAVRVHVDLLGRFKSVHIERDTFREGEESRLEGEIKDAHERAQRAANFLDFNLAELASELEHAPTLQRHLEEQAEQRDQRSSGRPDDEYFDDPLRHDSR